MDKDRFYPLTISHADKQTDDSVCLSFTVPPELAETFQFLPGQYLTLESVIDGRNVRRCYSICSGIDDGTLRVGIKKVPEGVYSTYAFGLQPGTDMHVMPPQGDFHTSLKPDQRRNYLCIAAGSGITPILAIVKSVLSVEPHSRVTLIYGNRSSNTIMFREELSFLKNQHMKRMQWINIYSREAQDAEVLQGHINNRKGGELQSKHLIHINDYDEFFLCGPESMLSEVSRGLRKEGIDEETIHMELFSTNAEDAKRTREKHKERAKAHGGKTSHVTIIHDGRGMDMEVAYDGENILAAALAHGIDLPFSCRKGVCATCKAKLREGRVDMDLDYALDAEEKQQGIVLCCQAHPVSERIVLDFDNR